jgi:hypothetical protein
MGPPHRRQAREQPGIAPIQNIEDRPVPGELGVVGQRAEQLVENLDGIDPRRDRIEARVVRIVRDVERMNWKSTG